MEHVLDKELHAYIDILDTDQKKSLLNVIKTFLNPSKVDRVSVRQYNKEIDEAEQRIKEGNFLSQEDVENESSSW